ncbi:hypothetical protein [Desulfosoma sp.]|uniref:hypothetical protein n=1 Tax=Desulfosoma sp. TaxID=2603217 RepID=UPI004049B869
MKQHKVLAVFSPENKNLLSFAGRRPEAFAHHVNVFLDLHLNQLVWARKLAALHQDAECFVPVR